MQVEEESEESEAEVRRLTVITCTKTLISLLIRRKKSSTRLDPLNFWRRGDGSLNFLCLGWISLPVGARQGAYPASLFPCVIAELKDGSNNSD